MNVCMNILRHKSPSGCEGRELDSPHHTHTYSGSVTRFVGIFLSHESNPSGPLINRLKWFCLKIRFRGDIQILSSKNSTPRCDNLRGVNIF